MLIGVLRKFLDGHHVKYVVMTHSPAYTAQTLAASAHISGKKIAKTVIVKVDGRMVMAVLPASDHVNLEGFKEASGAETVELASEEEFQKDFPGCEAGAMPPFGNLFEMPVFVSETLSQDAEIAFNAGTHRDLVKLAYTDYQKLVNPQVARF
jgi:Ala-tRNA(Pro) deacylase